MQLDDYPIAPDSQARDPISPPPPPKTTGRVLVVAAASFLVVGAIAAFFLMRPSDEPASPGARTVAATEPNPPASRAPLGPEVEARELPPIDLTDPIVRELLGALSSRPELAAWLATDGLVRNVVASIDAVANGTSPSAQLRPLAPVRPFTAVARGDDLVIDARSYQRYDGIADTVASMDADGLARAYATLRPRLQEAYVELGYPDGNIDEAVQRAIARLLNTPLLDREVDVRPAPVLYQFTDGRIERLSSAQKQLLRMGPRNQQLIQDKLRELTRALVRP